MNLTLVLKNHRSITGQSLRQLAKEIGIDHKVLHRIENGSSDGFYSDTFLALVNWLLK
jgi:cytoskeletal protein RodZ